jgi:hypothetical protein
MERLAKNLCRWRKTWSEARALPEGYIGPVKTNLFCYLMEIYFAQAVPKAHWAGVCILK